MFLTCFVSKVRGGRASDRHITLNSGFIDLIDHGDQIMADRGFLVKEEIMIKRDCGKVISLRGHRSYTEQHMSSRYRLSVAAMSQVMCTLVS
jgi:hypothetical protein